MKMVDRFGVQAYITAHYPPGCGKTLQLLHKKLGVVKVVAEWQHGVYTARITIMRWR